MLSAMTELDFAMPGFWPSTILAESVRRLKKGLPALPESTLERAVQGAEGPEAEVADDKMVSDEMASPVPSLKRQRLSFETPHNNPVPRRVPTPFPFAGFDKTILDSGSEQKVVQDSPIATANEPTDSPIAPPPARQ